MTDNLLNYSNARINNMGAPTDEQLDLINSKHAPKPVRAEDIFVFGSQASNSDYDSFHSSMDTTTLRNYADDFKEGRSLLAHHEDHDFALGRTFDTSFTPDTNDLYVATYVTRGLHLNKVASDDFIRGVETGIAHDVSIRYKGGEERCELCNQRVLSRSCNHMPGMRYDDKVATYRIFDGHAVEMSSVFKGSNKRTSILKARELRSRGVIDDRDLVSYDVMYNRNFRSLVNDPNIIQIAENLKLESTSKSFSNSQSYLERLDSIMEDCGVDGCTLKKGHEGEHSNAKKIDDKTRAICDVFLNYVQEKGATTAPDNMVRIREFLERAEKGDAKSPPYDAMQEKVDDDNKNEDAHDTGAKAKLRMVPVDRFDSVTSFLKQRSEKAGPMSAFNKGVTDGFDKGHTAGTMYPGVKLLENVPSQEWHLEGSDNGSDHLPADADSKSDSGVSTLSNPAIEIHPDGTFHVLLDGGSKVKDGTMGSASAGGVVPLRMEIEGEEKIVDVPFKPIRIELKANDIESLVDLANDGFTYRRSLEADGLKWGALRDEDKFDKDFNLRIMRSLPALSDLVEYVSQLRSSAQKKLKVNDIEFKSVDDFKQTPMRQTVSSLPTGRSISDKTPNGKIDDFSAFRV